MLGWITRIVRYLAVIGCCALGFATIVATGGGGGGPGGPGILSAKRQKNHRPAAAIDKRSAKARV